MLKPLRFAEAFLWSTALICAAAFTLTQVEAAGSKGQSNELTGARPAQGDSRDVSRTRTVATEGDSLLPSSKILGRLEIPALHLKTPIVDDDDYGSLLRGAGHIRGTAMPGGLGNFVIAAHRDTYFRPLAGIKAGMQMRVVTKEETFTYIVDSFKVVNPEDVYVLDTGDVPQMTLITCYPFHYIGAAPQRFAVSAHLLTY